MNNKEAAERKMLDNIKAKILTTKIYQVKPDQANLLVLLEIRELLEQIAQNTSTTGSIGAKQPAAEQLSQVEGPVVKQGWLARVFR